MYLQELVALLSTIPNRLHRLSRSPAQTANSRQLGQSRCACVYQIANASFQVENGTCKATLVDSATAEFRVANDFCGLEILPETFKAEQCEPQMPYSMSFILVKHRASPVLPVQDGCENGLFTSLVGYFDVVMLLLDRDIAAVRTCQVQVYESRDNLPKVYDGNGRHRAFNSMAAIERYRWFTTAQLCDDAVCSAPSRGQSEM